jgi:hypothetical protein
MMMRLSRVESQNLIFALLKNGYGHIISQFLSPPRDFIKQIALEVQSDRDGVNIHSVILNTMRLVEIHYSVQFKDSDFERFKAWCYKVANEFMKQPEEVRTAVPDAPDALETIH